MQAGLDVLPKVEQLCGTHGIETLFTQFITAKNAEEQKERGQWQAYYRHWEHLTQDKAGKEILRIHLRLARFATADRVFGKDGYSAFSSADFTERIRNINPSALIFTGVETQACVLATVLSAVDLGYKCVVAIDAVAASKQESHHACIQHVLSRFPGQIELDNVNSIGQRWSSP